MKSIKINLFFIISIGFVFSVQAKNLIVVAQDGSGDFKTITEAVRSLPMFNYERVTIFIKNGIYKEKIRIEQDYITLKGESKENTKVEYSQLRTDWINNKDSIGAAVINLTGDDIIIENLTVNNTQPQIGPHAFTIYGTGTRTIIKNCIVLSKGGDTVSLWNYKSGMYYHADCVFQGSVDFVCPRGWCFIRNSKFIELKKTASIWHAGGDNIDQKFVVCDSRFEGVSGFELGRHHYEAQFYLLNCSFSDSMNSKPIYRVKGSPERPFNWGERYYFFNCHRDGGNFSWLSNNLINAKNSPKAENITPEWTFDGKWNPESTLGPRVVGYSYLKGVLILYLNEKITVNGQPKIQINRNKEVRYISGSGSDTLKFETSEDVKIEDIKKCYGICDGKIIGNIATISERNLVFYLK